MDLRSPFRRRRHDDHTSEVIESAERTCADLKRLTGELAEYSAALRALVQLEAVRENERTKHRGRVEADERPTR